MARWRPRTLRIGARPHCPAPAWSLRGRPRPCKDSWHRCTMLMQRCRPSDRLRVLAAQLRSTWFALPRLRRRVLPHLRPAGPMSRTDAVPGRLQAVYPTPRGPLTFRPRAGVAELVDALDLGSSGETRGGSSPPSRIPHTTSRFGAKAGRNKLALPRACHVRRGHAPRALHENRGGHTPPSQARHECTRDYLLSSLPSSSLSHPSRSTPLPSLPNVRSLARSRSDR